ncbi:MFS transporter [Streptomyces pharetrae CZA14]|uniref:MFS transporter n=1 Tax=Streptomyces pharetrae CZA14 TaxID=1144883 RepID=A0ABX3YGW0_9ACTN|nr:MFS transporter [Streptomyces pharetrae CZA14]
MPGSVPLPSTRAEDAEAPPVAVTGPGHALRVALLMAGSCLPVLGAVLIAPVLPRMEDHFASSPGAKALVPLALTVPALALALLAPFAGVIVDRLGRKRLLVVATALYALFGTAPLWLDSLGAIIASRVLVGVTEAAIMTCCTTLIGDYYSGRRRVRYLALQTMCASASATAFLLLGGAVGAAGWRVPFWVYAVSLLLAPLMAVALPSPFPRAKRDGRTAADGPPAGAERPRPFRRRRLAGICALTFFGGTVFYTVPVEMAYLLDDLGVQNSGAVGLATAVASAATVAGAVLFTRLRRSPETVLPTVLGLCAVGFGVMCLAGNAPLLVVGAVLNCLGTGMLLPALLTGAMSRLAFADRGRGTGLWTAAFFGGEFVCPLVLLAVEPAVGGLAGAVGVLGLVTGAVAVGLWAAGRAGAGEAGTPASENGTHAVPGQPA